MCLVGGLGGGLGRDRLANRNIQGYSPPGGYDECHTTKAREGHDGWNSGWGGHLVSCCRLEPGPPAVLLTTAMLSFQAPSGLLQSEERWGWAHLLEIPDPVISLFGMNNGGQCPCLQRILENKTQISCLHTISCWLLWGPTHCIPCWSLFSA